MSVVKSLSHVGQTIFALFRNALSFFRSCLRSWPALAAENLFLRKQWAVYLERKVKPRQATDATRLTMALLSKLFEWRSAFTMGKPETLLGWHRKGFRLFWRWKSRPRGRPRLPGILRNLILQMARDNPTWGEERIADELLLKLGLRVAPRTVGRYMPKGRGRDGSIPAQRWETFVRSRSRAILACDFFVAATASFRLLYVFVIMEVGTRRIIHCNVTAHPTAGWTLQQFREIISGEQPQRFLIHDRDSIFSAELDPAVEEMGMQIMKTPVRAPQVDACCERLMIGTIRRECLDFVIPLSERHLRELLREWVSHYNWGRPHSSLGPGLPEGPSSFGEPELLGHIIPSDCRLVAKSILAGLHHEYRFETIAA